MKTFILSILLPAALATGCSFQARSTEDYRADTRTVLETKNASIKACYDSALAATPTQSGKVVVTFTVEKKTGALTNIAADPNQSSAPEGLQNCVVQALDGLALDPADRRQGDATFEWVFQSGAGAPTDAAAAAEGDLSGEGAAEGDAAMEGAGA